MTSQVGRSTGTAGALNIAKAFIAFIVGGIAMHFVVMLLDYFLMLE